MRIDDYIYYDDIRYWALKCGSEELREGLRAGRNMDPLIFIEWSMVFFPLFVLDLHRASVWRPSEHPSEMAFGIAEQIQHRRHIKEAFVVRAQRWPARYEGDGEKVEVIYSSGDAECVVVRDARIPYDLVFEVVAD